MTSQRITKVLFLDSMAYIHYKPIEDIEWLQEAGAEQVTIVVPRVTLRELDKQKNTHQSPKIRERVGGVLQRLEKRLLKGAELRSGVNIVRYQKHPSDAELTAKGLNPGWSDDVLLGTILLYRTENPDVEIMLVTQDTYPRLAALDHNLVVLSLPDVLKLPAELDPVLKENEQLRQRILREQSSRPKLHLAFTGLDQAFIEILVDASIPFSPEKGKQIVEEMAAKYPRVTGPSNADPYLVPTPEEYARYNRDRESFLSDYERYLVKKWDHEDAARRSVSLSLSLFNTGTRPAEDIDIHLHIPDGPLVHDREPSSRTPGEPTPPKSPRNTAQMMAEQMSGGMGLLGDVMSRATGYSTASLGSLSSGLTIKRTNSYEVTAHIDNLKHGYSVPISPVHLELEPHPSSFTIHYSLHPANLPESVEGDLHVKVKERYGAAG